MNKRMRLLNISFIFYFVFIVVVLLLESSVLIASPSVFVDSPSIFVEWESKSSIKITQYYPDAMYRFSILNKKFQTITDIKKSSSKKQKKIVNELLSLVNSGLTSDEAAKGERSTEYSLGNDQVYYSAGNRYNGKSECSIYNRLTRVNYKPKHCFAALQRGTVEKLKENWYVIYMPDAEGGGIEVRVVKWSEDKGEIDVGFKSLYFRSQSGISWDIKVYWNKAERGIYIVSSNPIDDTGTVKRPLESNNKKARAVLLKWENRMLIQVANKLPYRFRPQPGNNRLLAWPNEKMYSLCIGRSLIDRHCYKIPSKYLNEIK